MADRFNFYCKVTNVPCTLCPQTPFIGSHSGARHARGSSPPKMILWPRPCWGLCLQTLVPDWDSKEVATLVRTRGVVVNFDLGERFPRPRSQQRGELAPRSWHVAVLWVCVGAGCPLLLRASMGVTHGNFFLRFLMPRLGAIWARK